MHRNMYNIIAVFNTIKYPDVLLTIACSLQWKESKDTLIAGDKLQIGLLFTLVFFE